MNIPELTSVVTGPFGGTKAVPIEAAGSAREVADRIREGKAVLKVVSTPWGVEFYICEVGDN